MSWHSAWLLGLALYLPIALAALWHLWWKHGPTATNRDDASRRSVYKSNCRGNVAYGLGTFAFYYAAYVIVSLVRAGKISQQEALVHLAVWTLAPPLWFFVEWFLWFDNHENTEARENFKVAQDLAGKFWAGVLALMLSYRLGEIVTDLLKNASGANHG